MTQHFKHTGIQDKGGILKKLRLQHENDHISKLMPAWNSSWAFERLQITFNHKHNMEQSTGRQK